MNTAPSRQSGTSLDPASSSPRLGRRRVARTSILALLAVPFLTAAVAGPAAATTAARSTQPAGPATADDATTVASRIDEFMSTQIKDSAIPGAAVAVVRGDQVLLVRGYGHDSNGKAVTGDSLFRVASLSKSFSALAVMQLVEEGRLGLDDKVQQHLPQLQLSDPRAGQITVRELLNHTSGLTDAMVPELSRTPPRTTEEATRSLWTAHLATAPGTAYSYHNPNYQVAARLVEELSGEPFDVYLRRHVFEPAGMTSSTTTTMDDDRVPGLPPGHVTAYGHAFSVPNMGSFTVGDGGVVSSATDMARWLIVNANGGRAADGTRLVSVHGLQTLHTPSAPKSGYALGWSTRGPATSPTRLEHSGSLFTYTAEEAVWPRTRYGVVLLFNAGSPMMFDQIAISHGVFDIVEGTTPPRSGPHSASRFDTALGVLTVLALTLGVSGVLRAGRWARRRRSTPVRRILALLPLSLVLVAGAGFPDLVETLLSRDATWTAALYTWPALVVFVLAAVAAAGSTLLVRVWQWTRHRRGDTENLRPAAATNAPSSVAMATSRATG